MRKEKQLTLSPSYNELRRYILNGTYLTNEDCKYLAQTTEEYFNNESLAVDAYLAKDSLPVHPDDYFGQYDLVRPKGEWETPAWTWLRVAIYMASAEIDDGGEIENAQDLALIWFRMMCRREMVPGGQVIRGSANTSKISLINCTHAALTDDSIEAIYETDYKIAKVESYGEGVGVDSTILRPKGSPVNNAARSTSGAVSWMQRFDNTTATIAQEGRRGALLISMDISHPEVLDFIHIKSDLKLVNNANISVRVSNEFMMAYLKDEDWTFMWRSPDGQSFFKGATVKAREVMREIAKFSAKYAEPGLQFPDTVRLYSNSDALGFPVVGTNACSELWLCDLDSCVLAHQNFGALNDLPLKALEEAYHRGYYVSWFCDNVVTKQIVDNRSPLPKSKDVSFTLRRIGAGPTGYADYFARVGVKYGSPESIALAESLTYAHTRGAYDRSKEAARLKGPFPGYDPELDNSKFMQDHPEFKGPRRNVCCTTCAPVGTGMILLGGNSNGVEPMLYFYGWRRTRVSGEYRWYFVVNRAILDQLDHKTKAVIATSIADINEEEDAVVRGHIEDAVITVLNANFPDGVETCHSIDPLAKADMMGQIQRHIDSSISVTYNLPSTATVEDIERLYVRCWQNELKGVAIYREDPDNREPIFQYTRPQTYNYAGSVQRESIVPKRERSLPGVTVKCVADGYKFYITLNFCESKLNEVFVSTNEQEPKVNTEAAQTAIVNVLVANGVDKAVVESQIKQSARQAGYARIARLISIGLRCGVEVKPFTKALNEIEVLVSSYIFQLRRVLSEFADTEDEIETCPACSEDSLIVSAGCKSCLQCGYSKC